MTISATEAQRLFTSLRGVTREGQRVLSASGKFPSDLKRALIAYVDRLEADLKVGV